MRYPRHLTDTLAYGVTLSVPTRSPSAQARAALAK
jgi:hypothetical protein